MNETYSVFSFKFLRSYVIQCRPYLLFVSGIAGLAGISIVEMTFLTNLNFWFAFIPLFLGYGFGQALTDTWQTDTDALSAPYRPLSKGIISKESVRLVSVSGLLVCSGLLIYLNLWNIVFGILTIIGLTTYSYFKRNFWFIGPFYNAWIVALLPIMGYLSVSGVGLEELLRSEIILLCSLSFMSYTNFVLIGYLKDISADQATNYNTFPVIFGWNKTIWVGDVIVLISSLIIFTLVKTNIGFLMAVIATTIAVMGQLYAHLVKIKNEANASYPIIMTVRSFIFWHGAAILDNQPNWIYFLLLFYFFFELFLYLRPERAQI